MQKEFYLLMEKTCKFKAGDKVFVKYVRPDDANAIMRYYVGRIGTVTNVEMDDEYEIKVLFKKKEEIFYEEELILITNTMNTKTVKILYKKGK